MSARIEDDLTKVLVTVPESSDTDLLLISPPTNLLKTILSEYTISTEQTISVVASDQKLQTLISSFYLATQAAELIEQGSLNLKTSSTGSPNPLILTGNQLTTLILFEDDVGVLSIRDHQLSSQMLNEYTSLYQSADIFTIRTPSRSVIRRSLVRHIDRQFQRALDDLLDELSRIRVEIDAVELVLLLAARQGKTLYDISKWGESINFASRSTFSRKKSQLVDQGLIQGEPISMDSNPPKLRLSLSEERLTHDSLSEFSSAVRRLVGP